MRIGILVTAVYAVVEVYLSLISELNSGLELLLKLAAAAAAIGASWRWAVGPGYKRARGAFHWIKERLELITTLDERLERIDQRLEDGDLRFDSVDQVLDVIRNDATQEVKAAIREGRPVRLLEDGAPDRRHEDRRAADAPQRRADDPPAAA